MTTPEISVTEVGPTTPFTVQVAPSAELPEQPLSLDDQLEMYDALIREGNYMKLNLVQLQEYSKARLSDEEEIILVDRMKAGEMAREDFASFQSSETPLSKKQRKVLLQTIVNGNNARNDLIAANYGQVVKVAKGFPHHFTIAPTDLIAGGLVGLVQATKKFDPSKDARFSTYARFWIFNGVMDAIEENSMIPIQERARKSIKRIKDAYEQLSQRLHREPTTCELAKEAQTTPERITWFLDVDKREPLSFDAFVHDNEDADCPHERILDSAASAEDQVIAWQEDERLLKEVRTLPTREQKIIFLRYAQDLTVRETAEKMKHVKTRRGKPIRSSSIGYIEQRTLIELRESLADLDPSYQ